MDTKTFLNKYDNLRSYDAIDKLIFNFDLSREKAKKIYKNWRKDYLNKYTPKEKLKKNYYTKH